MIIIQICQPRNLLLIHQQNIRIKLLHIKRLPLTPRLTHGEQINIHIGLTQVAGFLSRHRVLISIPSTRVFFIREQEDSVSVVLLLVVLEFLLARPEYFRQLAAGC